MKIKLNSCQQKFLFLISITIIYILLVIWLDFLQGAYLWDEIHYWESSLVFSERLLPSIDDLKNYNELNTPLPFIVYGALEYLFGQGIFSGRLLNLILSLSIALIIGCPSRKKPGQPILCLIGLFLCPYFLFYSGRLYTDIIACFWTLIGVMSYVRNRHFISSISFILAIASRQYMLAFPAAILTYEFILAAKIMIRDRQISLVKQWKWIAPLIAVLTIFGWIYLFQGLAPQTAIEIKNTPEVQKTIWAVTPGGIINFFAFVGFYIVIPEFILFQPGAKLKTWKRQRRKIRLKISLFAGLLLLYFCIFPPLLEGLGIVIDIADLLPKDFLKIFLFYCLSLLTCIRFSQFNLISMMVLFNSAIAIKAYPWDKYVLPLAIVFWYFKSIKIDKINS